MIDYSITDLARIVRAEPINNNTVFTGVSTDSREVRAGDCFFAIVGDNFDGHDYVADAMEKGAVCAVVNKSSKVDGPSVVKVDDTVKAFGRLAYEYRRRCDFKVIGITGSAGKTSTRQIIFHVLKDHFRVSQSPKNFNNSIGLPLSILSADHKDQVLVTELGTNYPGEIASLTRIARPDIAVVTNTHPAHLSGLGSLETIVKEKLSISEGLEPEGILIINADCGPLVRAAKGLERRYITFGRCEEADIRGVDIILNGWSSSFTVDGTRIDLPLAGPGNVENALAAWAVCSQLGVSIEDFARAVADIGPVSMRAQVLNLAEMTILNDCYNANPASMKNALAILSSLGVENDRRRVFVCGDMAELGDMAEQLHIELGSAIAASKVAVLLAVGEYADVTASAARSSADYPLETKCFADTISLCNNLEKFIADTDIVLVKGSRINKLESAVESLTELFSGK